VVFGGDEVQGAQKRDNVALEAAGVVKVELLQRLAGRKAGSPDAAFAAIRFAGRDLTLQTRRQELLIAPRLGAARAASRSTASRRVGAFNARAK
jgi:hypothetical protein